MHFLPQVLTLSDNRLVLPPHTLRVLPTLRALVLNDCNLSWQQVLSLEPALPALQELHLCGNPIRDLQPAAACSATVVSEDGSSPAQPTVAVPEQGSPLFANLQVCRDPAQGKCCA